jgi:hypothetical protein
LSGHLVIGDIRPGLGFFAEVQYQACFVVDGPTFLASPDHVLALEKKEVVPTLPHW